MHVGPWNRNGKDMSLRQRALVAIGNLASLRLVLGLRVRRSRTLLFPRDEPPPERKRGEIHPIALLLFAYEA